MRVIRFIVILVLVLLGIVTALVLVLPVKQHAESRVTIQAPAAVAYQYLLQLSNAKDWLPAGNQDSLRISTSGDDGTTGASVSWTGKQPATKGTLYIAELKENSSVEWNGQITYPQQESIEITFKLKENNGATVLEMEYDLLTPRPQNLLAVFKGLNPSVKKQLDRAVQQLALKLAAKNAGVKLPTFTITQINFPATTYLVTRAEGVASDSIATWAAQQHSFLYDQLVAANGQPGRPVIFLPTENSSAPEMVEAGIIIPENTEQAGIQAERRRLPASKALELEYNGPPSQIEMARMALRSYCTTNGFTYKDQFIEEQLTGSSATRFHTRIILRLE